MTNEENIKSVYPDENLVFLRGFDDAIIGTAISTGNPVVCYSISKMINNLMHHQNMTESEARNWLDYNTLYAFFGENSPVYLDDSYMEKKR
jgi:hypothetical protein